MSVITFSNLLIIIGIVWIISGYFTYMQTVKINRIMTELGKKAERLYSGKNAGFPLTRCVIFAATTGSGTIVEARLLRTAFIFRRAKDEPYDIIHRYNVFNLRPQSFNVSTSEQKALANLIKDARKRN
jgi:hypothetical protein